MEPDSTTAGTAARAVRPTCLDACIAPGWTAVSWAFAVCPIATAEAATPVKTVATRMVFLDGLPGISFIGFGLSRHNSRGEAGRAVGYRELLAAAFETHIYHIPFHDWRVSLEWGMPAGGVRGPVRKSRLRDGTLRSRV